MFKKLLFSALILGALAATVGAASLSAFTTEATTTGTLTLGTVHLEAYGSDSAYHDNATVVFAPQALTPGHHSDSTTYLKNFGTAGVVGITHSSAAVQNTFGPLSTNCIPYLTLQEFGTPSSLGAGVESGAITIRATLDSSAVNDCQGVTFTITTTFDGSAA